MAEPESDAQATTEEQARIAALEERVGTLTTQVTEIRHDLGTLTTQVTGLQRDLREVIHDVLALATLAGHTFGEPFRSQAHEIVSKRQVA